MRKNKGKRKSKGDGGRKPASGNGNGNGNQKPAEKRTLTVEELQSKVDQTKECLLSYDKGMAEAKAARKTVAQIYTDIHKNHPTHLVEYSEKSGLGKSRLSELHLIAEGKRSQEEQAALTTARSQKKRAKDAAAKEAKEKRDAAAKAAADKKEAERRRKAIEAAAVKAANAGRAKLIAAVSAIGAVGGRADGIEIMNGIAGHANPARIEPEHFEAVTKALYARIEQINAKPTQLANAGKPGTGKAESAEDRKRVMGRHDFVTSAAEAKRLADEVRSGLGEWDAQSGDAELAEAAGVEWSAIAMLLKDPAPTQPSAEPAAEQAPPTQPVDDGDIPPILKRTKKPANGKGIPGDPCS